MTSVEQTFLELVDKGYSLPNVVAGATSLIAKLPDGRLHCCGVGAAYYAKTGSEQAPEYGTLAKQLGISYSWMIGFMAGFDRSHFTRGDIDKTEYFAGKACGEKVADKYVKKVLYGEE